LPPFLSFVEYWKQNLVRGSIFSYQQLYKPTIIFINNNQWTDKVTEIVKICTFTIVSMIDFIILSRTNRNDCRRRRLGEFWVIDGNTYWLSWIDDMKKIHWTLRLYKCMLKFRKFEVHNSHGLEKLSGYNWSKLELAIRDPLVTFWVPYQNHKCPKFWHFFISH